jgi:hypothetical protein
MAAFLLGTLVWFCASMQPLGCILERRSFHSLGKILCWLNSGSVVVAVRRGPKEDRHSLTVRAVILQVSDPPSVVVPGVGPVL